MKIIRGVYKNYIINNACKYGHVQVLEWFKNSSYEFKYDERTIFYASINGHVQVLEWFKNSEYEFKYDFLAINYASYHGRIQVLEWFKNSGYELKYDEGAISEASKNRHNKILKFFSNNFNIKKLIKWTQKIIFIKTIKFKTKNKYIKGYQKN